MEQDAPFSFHNRFLCVDGIRIDGTSSSLYGLNSWIIV